MEARPAWSDSAVESSEAFSSAAIDRAAAGWMATSQARTAANESTLEAQSAGIPANAQSAGSSAHRGPRLSALPRVGAGGRLPIRVLEPSDGPAPRVEATLDARLDEGPSWAYSFSGEGAPMAGLLARVIYVEGKRLIEAGVNVGALKEGMDTAVAVVLDGLAQLAGSRTDHHGSVRAAAFAASQDQDIAGVVVKAFEQVGHDGVIVALPGQAPTTSVEVVPGAQIDGGWASPAFITDTARQEAVLVDPCILVCDQALSRMSDVLPLLERAAQAGRPLLIVARDIDGEALATLIVNRLRGLVRVCAVRYPRSERGRETLRDLAAMVGARLVTAMDLGPDDLWLEDLGRATNVVVGRDLTTIVGCVARPGAVEDRVERIRAQLGDMPTEAAAAGLRRRLDRLISAVAVIRLGGPSEADLKHARALVERALFATRQTLEEDSDPGDGSALLDVLPSLDAVKLVGDQRHGVRIIRTALAEPARQAAIARGAVGTTVMAGVLVDRGTRVPELRIQRREGHEGAPESVRLMRAALRSAVTIASLMLSTEALLAGGGT